MKKLTKLLSLLALAGAMAGTAAAAGCSHKHSYESGWSSGEEGHWHASACGHNPSETEPHEDKDDDGICDICEYVIEVKGGQEDPDVVKYEVKFYSEGQLLEDKTQKIVKGQTAQPPTGVTKQGHTLVYWAVGSVDGDEYNFDTPVNGPVSLYAVWLPDDQVVAVESVTITAPTPAEVLEDETITLTATVSPANATIKNVMWTSSDPLTASVSQTGVVMGLKPGTVTITASAGGKSDVCSVEVKVNPAKVKELTITETVKNVELTNANKTVTFTLTATVKPDTAVAANPVTWQSSNPTIASVDGGVVTCKKEGTAEIVAKAGGLTAKCTVTVTDSTTKYEVKFYSEDELIDTQYIVEGEYAKDLKGVSKYGCILTGWAEGSSSGSLYTFETPVEGALNLYAVWEDSGEQSATEAPMPAPPAVVNPTPVNQEITHFYAANESAAIEWSETSIANVKVEYKISSGSDWKEVEKTLIRQINGTTARVDIIGLKVGTTLGNTYENYDFKITGSSKTLTEENVKVTAYDRSGYAHFNYTDGVGAYNDDGTIKENVLVIYLTDANKHDITNDCYVNGQKVDITQYITDAAGTAHKGVGEIFNNRRYSGNDRKNVGISRLCQEFGGVALRVIGTVTNVQTKGISSIVGLTDFDSEGNGGTIGDSGGMARMVNAKNLTIEGVGEDAVIKGWGFHFISSTGSRWGANDGKNFEARNITYTGYPEDALGAEGEQAGKKATDDLLASVERVWVHHNTFEQGGTGSGGAESDKSEGDGSCDFKRGLYYTNSYNKYEVCHKTNLVGSSSTSVQYNVTFHHNWWYNCHARQPIARLANIHYYNNFVQYTGSVAMSFRANSYTFAEANYFEGCSKVWNTGEGAGAHKYYNNIEVGTYGGGAAVDNVSSRTAKVANNCKFLARNIDYTSFDTNPDLFYYNAQTQQSDCILTDAVTARRDCIMFAGVQKHDYEDIDADASKYTPSKDVEVSAEGWTEIEIPSAKNDAESKGVIFRDGTAKGKGKGQYVTFRLADRTEIDIVAGGNGDLIREDGFVLAKGINKYNNVLEAGTYFIRSSFAGLDSNMKEVTITSLKFRKAMSDADRVQNVISIINAIGEVTYTEASKEKIEAAQTAYASLKNELRGGVTNIDKLVVASFKYDKLAAKAVSDIIEALGIIDENSGAKLAAARQAYNTLTVEQKALVEDDIYAFLEAAEYEYENYKVIGVNKAIAALTPVSASNLASLSGDQLEGLLEEYNAVKAMYDDLDEDQQKDVVGYATVTAGIAAIENALKPYAVIAMIEELPAVADVTLSDGAAINAAKAAYDALDAAGKAKISAALKQKLDDALDKLAVFASQSQVGIFTAKDKSLAGIFSVSRTNGKAVNYKDNKVKFTYDGTEYDSPLKMESEMVITFTTTVAMQMTICIHKESGGKTLKVDNGETLTADGDGFFVIENLAAGTHTINRTSEAWLCYIVLTPKG